MELIAQENLDTVYNSETLKLIKLSESSILHISYLQVPRFGKVACNGVVFTDQNKALIVDTPANNEAANELKHWIQNTSNMEIIGVVASHFHEDCLGGLAIFHKEDIDSYSHEKTQLLAKSQNYSIPKIGFKSEMKLTLGNSRVVLNYFGEGHTSDNITAYYEKDQILFGGCLIKSLKSGKGNLDDANTLEWSDSVSKIYSVYEDLKYVIPGHGQVGSNELLRHTIDMFKTE